MSLTKKTESTVIGLLGLFAVAVTAPKIFAEMAEKVKDSEKEIKKAQKSANHFHQRSTHKNTHQQPHQTCSIKQPRSK